MASRRVVGFARTTLVECFRPRFGRVFGGSFPGPTRGACSRYCRLSVGSIVIAIRARSVHSEL